MNELFSGDYRELAAELGFTDKSFRLRQGRVISIANNYPFTTTLGITLGDSSVTVTGVKYLKHYAPVVNDYVWVLQSGSDLLVVGSITGNGLPFPYFASGSGVTVSTGPNTIATLNIPAQTFPFRVVTYAQVLGNCGGAYNATWFDFQLRFENVTQRAARLTGGTYSGASTFHIMDYTSGGAATITTVLSRTSGTDSVTTYADGTYNFIEAQVFPI